MDWIGFDADDTLWENETFFRLTESTFLDLISPHAGADRQRIADHLLAVETRNLGIYGYGIKGFMLSMIQTAVELTGGRVPGHAIGDILSRGQEMLAHPVHLIDGAAETVAAVAPRRRILITKGDVIDQERKIALSGLAEAFDAIEIVQDKSPATYARLFARHGIAPDRFLMVGNAMRSDILPVLEAGGWAVHVPHDLTWSVERAEDPDHPRFARLRRIADLPALLVRLESADA